MTAEDAGRLRADAIELEADAEAWIECQPPDDRDPDHMAHWRRQVRVARALLALLPAADAGEAVTTDRLRAIPGATAVGQLTTWGAAPRVTCGPRFGVTGEPLWTAEDKNGMVVLPTPATMTEVRRLLAALGVPLAPAAGGGAGVRCLRPGGRL